MNKQTPKVDSITDLLKRQLTELKTAIDLLNLKPQASPDELRFYGDKELAKYLNCTVQTVSRQKKAGKIPFHRYGRKYYYLRTEIDEAFKQVHY